MARTPKPWYRAAKDAWFVELDGRQIRLATGLKNKSQAIQAFHQLMASSYPAAETKTPPKLTPLASLSKLAAAYLFSLETRCNRGEITRVAVDDWIRRTEGFIRLHGRRSAAAIKPEDLAAWLKSTTWGPTTCHDAANAVTGMFRWATPKYLAQNPLANAKAPPRRPRRETVLTDPVRAKEIVDSIKSAEFRDLMTFLFLTGCRPCEARTMTAADCDLDRRIVVLKQHKTARATGRDRVIVLTDAAFDLVSRLVLTHRTGPIFRNEIGNPWNRNSINCAIRRLREKTGADHELIAYAFRHLFVTDALEAGVPIATVAALAGHSSTAMVARTYSRLDTRIDHLLDATKKVR